MGRHEGKVLICAGSATGMGAETARRMGREGAKVAIGDINHAAAVALAEELTAAGTEALAFACNIANEAEVEALVRAAVGRFGRLDLMHVNAARISSGDGDAVSTELAVFDQLMAVNLRGHLLCTRLAIPEMLKTGGGAIVYTSSSVSRTPTETRLAYQISKAALNALMRHVAKRWGKQGIRANAIAPGLIVTDFMRGHMSPEQRAQVVERIPSPRAGTVEDIAAFVSFLLSDEAGFINGQTLGIDGGTNIFD